MKSASLAWRWSSSVPTSPTSRCISAGCWSACAFGVQRRDAERLKCFYGSAMTSPRDNHEMIEASQIGAEPGAEPMKITRAQLMMVIRQKVEDLTNEIEGS